MNKSNKKLSHVSSLPSIAEAKGQTYKPHHDVWRFEDNTSAKRINFEPFKKLFTPELLDNLKNVVINRLDDMSIGDARNHVEYLKNCLNTETLLNEIKLENLRIERPTDYIRIPVFIKYWYELQIPGVEEETYQQIKKLKRPKQDHGRAVRISDPKGGALTSEEVEVLIAKLNQLFSQNEISVEEFLVLNVLLVTGARGAQICALKCSSIQVRENEILLKIPKIKNNKPLYRDTTDFKLNHKYKIWELLLAHKNALIGKLASESDPKLFPWKSSSNLNNRINNLNKTKIKLYTDRIPDDGIMPIPPTRIRHTVGTKLAVAGKGVFVIAETLGHSNAQTAQVYIDSTPELNQRISDSMSKHLTPFAQAFMGKLIDSEDEFISPDGESKQKKRVEFGAKATVGNCGKYGFCTSRAPISCYTCSMFQPWVDAPHIEIYNFLKKEREENHKITRDVEVSTINDLTIRAVLQVIKACEERKNER
jgi:integrase